MMLVTDSVVVQAALRRRLSRSEGIMHYIRRHFWLAVEFNFEFKSIYIKSKDNIICDTLSHLDDVNSNGCILKVYAGGLLCCRVEIN